MQKVLLDNKPSIVNDWLALPKERQRLLWYTDKMNVSSWAKITYSITEEKIVYSETALCLKMGANGGLYCGPVAKHTKGFTLNKKTKKLKMWLGSSIGGFSNYFREFLKDMKVEWVDNEGFCGGRWLTPSVLGDILIGKITNPTNLCKKIIGVNGLKSSVSPERLRQAIKRNGVQKYEVCQLKRVVKDIDYYLERGRSLTGIESDLIKQAHALGQVVDLRWSPKRINEVHDDWTALIMEREMDGMSEEPLARGWEIALPKGFEIINSKKRLFLEGAVMKHCVYTNYWNRVRNNSYMVVHVTATSKPVTVGINTIGGFIDQMNYKFNDRVSEVDETMIRDVINEDFLKTIKPEKIEIEHYSNPF